LKKFDSINVVPFIDIMLVLLVIVLTTASFVQKGILPVNLSSSKSSYEKVEEKSIIITINKNNKIFFEKEQINKNQILEKISKFDKNISIYLNCDKDIKFDNFVEVLDLIRKNGYNNLGIVTKEN
jgi:biopolymer transport protein ExbD